MWPPISWFELVFCFVRWRCCGLLHCALFGATPRLYRFFVLFVAHCKGVERKRSTGSYACICVACAIRSRIPSLYCGFESRSLRVRDDHALVSNITYEHHKFGMTGHADGPGQQGSPKSSEVEQTSAVTAASTEGRSSAALSTGNAASNNGKSNLGPAAPKPSASEQEIPTHINSKGAVLRPDATNGKTLRKKRKLPSVAADSPGANRQAVPESRGPHGPQIKPGTVSPKSGASFEAPMPIIVAPSIISVDEPMYDEDDEEPLAEEVIDASAPHLTDYSSRISVPIQASVSDSIVDPGHKKGSHEMNVWMHRELRKVLATASNTVKYVSANAVIIGNPGTFNRDIMPSVAGYLNENICFRTGQYFNESQGIFVVKTACGRFWENIVGQHRTNFNQLNLSVYGVCEANRGDLLLIRNIYEGFGPERRNEDFSISFKKIIRREAEAIESRYNKDTFVGECFDILRFVMDPLHRDEHLLDKEECKAIPKFFELTPIEKAWRMPMVWYYKQRYGRDLYRKKWTRKSTKDGKRKGGSTEEKDQPLVDDDTFLRINHPEVMATHYDEKDRRGAAKFTWTGILRLATFREHFPCLDTIMLQFQVDSKLKAKNIFRNIGKNQADFQYWLIEQMRDVPVEKRATNDLFMIFCQRHVKPWSQRATEEFRKFKCDQARKLRDASGEQEPIVVNDANLEKQHELKLKNDREASNPTLNSIVERDQRHVDEHNKNMQKLQKEREAAIRQQNAARKRQEEKEANEREERLKNAEEAAEVRKEQEIMREEEYTEKYLKPNELPPVPLARDPKAPRLRSKPISDSRPSQDVPAVPEVSTEPADIETNLDEVADASAETTGAASRSEEPDASVVATKITVSVDDTEGGVPGDATEGDTPAESNEPASRSGAPDTVVSATEPRTLVDVPGNTIEPVSRINEEAEDENALVSPTNSINQVLEGTDLLNDVTDIRVSDPFRLMEQEGLVETTNKEPVETTNLELWSSTSPKLAPQPASDPVMVSLERGEKSDEVSVLKSVGKGKNRVEATTVPADNVFEKYDIEEAERLIHATKNKEFIYSRLRCIRLRWYP